MPGDRVRTGPCARRQARLLNHEDPIYQSKINYAAIDTMWISNTVIFANTGAWSGVPLAAFASGRADIRTRCIRCMLSSCERAPPAASQLSHGVAVSEAAPRDADKPVAVRDIVATMDTILSRAASYMVCTGMEKPGNYGESLVQGNPMRRCKVSQSRSAVPSHTRTHTANQPPPHLPHRFALLVHESWQGSG